jgi:hypothetical protein
MPIVRVWKAEAALTLALEEVGSLKLGSEPMNEFFKRCHSKSKAVEFTVKRHGHLQSSGLCTNYPIVVIRSMNDLWMYLGWGHEQRPERDQAE